MDLMGRLQIDIRTEQGKRTICLRHAEEWEREMKMPRQQLKGPEPCATCIQHFIAALRAVTIIPTARQ